MAGSIKWNLISALFGFLFIFLLSFTSNIWQTSIIRGTISFFLFFMITFLFRALWGFILTEPSTEITKEEEAAEEAVEREDTEENAAKETSELIRSLLAEDNNNQ